MSTTAEHTTKEHPGIEYVQEQVRIIVALTHATGTPKPLNIISAGRIAAELDDLGSMTSNAPHGMPTEFYGLLTALYAVASLLGLPEEDRGSIRGQNGDLLDDNSLAWAANDIGEALNKMVNGSEVVS